MTFGLQGRGWTWLLATLLTCRAWADPPRTAGPVTHPRMTSQGQKGQKKTSPADPGRPARQPTLGAAATTGDATTQQAPDIRSVERHRVAPRLDRARQKAQAAVLLARAQAAVTSKDFQEALALLTAARALGADEATVLAWRAQIAIGRQRWSRADRLYERLAALRPQDPHVLLTLAQLDLKTGKLIWAMRRFQAASHFSEVADRALLGLARTLIEMGEFGDALEQAQAAAKKAKTKARRRKAMALAAVCRYRLDRPALARQAALSAGASPVTRRLEELLIGRLTGPESRWSLHLSTGMGTDSNPTMGPEPVPGWTGRAQAALDLVIQADAAWRPMVRPRHVVLLQGAVTRHFYIAPWKDEWNAQVSSFDMTTLSAGGDYFRRHLIQTGMDAFRIGYHYELVELDGGAGISSEPGPFLYSERHRLILGWNRHWDEAALDLRLEPSYAAFRDRDRDGPSLKILGDLSRFFLGRRLRLYGRTSLEWSHARWSPWRWLGLGLWTAASYLAPWQMDLVAWASYDFHDHFLSKDAFPQPGANPWGLPSGQVRRDHLLTFAFGLGRKIDTRGRWRLDVKLSYLTSRSTAAFYTYSRLVALLAVTGHMGG